MEPVHPQPVSSSLASANRREFLKSSSAIALGAGALQLSMQSAVYAGSDDTIKIGLVGCGGRGTGAVKDALSTDNNTKLVAVGDVFEERAKGASQSLKDGLGDRANRIDVKDDKVFVGFDAYQKVIDSGVDVVILATPPGFRPIHFEAAVKANKHVFMEKPVAVDIPGVRQVLAAAKLAKEKKLKVGVGLQRRHQASYLETIKRIQDGAIGKPLAFRVYWNGGGVWDPPLAWEAKKTEMEYQLRNWYYYNWLCGDHIVEQHIHNLDIANWVKGEPPVRASGMGGRQVRTDKKYGEIYDHHYVEYEYKDGSRVYSQCRHIANTWNSVSEYVQGTNGSSDISGGRITGLDGKETFRYRGPNPNPYVVEHHDLQVAIKAGQEYNEAEYGATSSMMSIVGRLATYSGQVIEWEEALKSDVSLMPKQFSFTAEPPVKADAEGRYAVALPGLFKPL